MGTGLVIDLENGCKDPVCRAFAKRIGDAMVPDFCEGLAIMPIPVDDSFLEGGDRRQFRSRANRAEKMGYALREFQPRDWAHDMVKINRSMPERQGRPMSDHYVNPTSYPFYKPLACPQHGLYWYGVFLDQRLRAYCSWYRVGELLQTNIWIGHGDYNRDGIMYYMMRESLRAQREVGPGYVMYHRYDGGGVSWNGGGLRQWKKQVGFEKMNVVWV